MIKVVIVDDEKESRQGLRQLLSWGDMGMAVVGEAENGLDALSLIRRQAPDIVLLDIKMPKMDGLECAKQIRQINPHANLIFISGYGDLESLRAAIKLRAVDFIDKPVPIPELKKLLIDIAGQLHEREQKRQADAWSYREHMRDREVLAQRLIEQLIAKRGEASAILSCCERLAIPLHRNDQLCCILFETNGHDGPDSIRAGAASEALGTVLPRDGYACGTIGDCQLAVFLFGDYAGTASAHRFERMRSAIGNLSPGLSVTVGVGKTVRGVESAHPSYETAQSSLRQKFLYGTGKIFRDDGGQAGEARPHAKALADIRRDAVSKMDRFDALAVAGLNSLAEMLKKHPYAHDLSDVKALYTDILLHFLALCKAGGLYGDESEQKWAGLVNSLTADELNAFLTEKISEISMSKSEMKRYSFRVRNAVRFLMKNHPNAISVDDISDVMGLSKAYACSLFKKETGRTINQYLESIRIQEASRLLKTTNLRLTEVARQVGYNNAAYFIAVFKKATGLSPTEYRDML